jgi:RND superfamily putative drug exporter
MVLVFWIAVFAVAGPLAGKLNSAQQNDASAWLPKNAESTQVVELAVLAQRHLPGAGGVRTP